MQRSQFAKEYNAFFKELDEHYRTYPVNVDSLEEELWKKLEQNPNASGMEKKRWVYRLIAEKCEVKIFRHCPFYFEVITGRIRNSVGSAYPPIPGLDSWVMRSDKTGFLDEFQGWVKPYMDDDIIDATMYMDCAHHGMGVEEVLKYGFAGLKEKAEKRRTDTSDSKELEFLESVIVSQESLIRLTERFSQTAEEMLKSETDEVVRKRLERIRDSAKRAPIYPAKTFFEALNAIWYLKEIGNTFEALGFAILGHVDRILAPYYERDIREGIIIREEAKDLVTWFVAMTDARWDLTDTPYGTNTTINIGGCDRDGTPVFNDITRFVIEAYQEYHFVNPKLQARFSPEAPDEYYDMIASLASSGANVLSIFNDEILIKGEVEKGKKLEDARLYVSGGCQETVLAGTEFGSRAFCYLNPTKYLLMMIFPEQYEFFENEGIVPVSMEYCRDFEEFYERVFYNLKLIVNALAWKFNGFERKWKEYNPCPLYSATIEDCIENARDVSEGGARYNGSAFAVSGIGTFIDSLYAVKRAVFELKKISWEQMKYMLRTNFEGEESTRQWLLTRLEKYGEDTNALKGLTEQVFNDMAVTTSGMQNQRGGQYEGSLWSFYGYEWLKAGTGASPNGRKKGESLSRGINPEENVNTTILHMVHSIAGVDMSRFPGTAVFYFEMPLTLVGQDVKVFEYLIRYFLKSGGNVFDFDVVDAAAMEDAMVHPERHQNLVVRVCGYSARFVTLEKEMQIEIMNRAKRMA